MSIDDFIKFVSGVAPYSFAIALVSGIVGSLTSSWLFKKALRAGDSELRRKLDGVIAMQISAKYVKHTETIEDNIASLILQIKETERAMPVSMASFKLAKLGEYVANSSPEDSIIKGVAK